MPLTVLSRVKIFSKEETNAVKEAKALGISNSHLLGLYPSAGFTDFLWGGMLV